MLKRQRPSADDADVDLTRMTNAEVLGLSGQTLAELRRRGVLRTGNAPTGDLAECLVADAMGGLLAPNSQKSWDILVPTASDPTDGIRVQVKARVVAMPLNRGERQVSAFRSWDFDEAMFVLFHPDYQVRRAALLDRDDVRPSAHHIDFTASDRVFATDDLLDRGEDWTDRLRDCALWQATGVPAEDAA